MVGYRIGDASSLIGLLLVLVTLFTSEQARALETERHRPGGAAPGARKRIRALAVALAAVTSASIGALAPVIVDVVGTCCEGPWDPVRAVFALIWTLLFPLTAWQVAIALGANRLSG